MLNIPTLETDLEKEKNHLEKIIQVVRNGGERLREPYQTHYLSISEHLSMIARSLDRLSERVQ